MSIYGTIVLVKLSSENMQSGIPKTVLAAFSLYCHSEQAKQNPKLIPNLKTVLRRYVLPYYELEASELLHDLEGCLEKVLIKDFANAEAVFTNSTQVLAQAERSGAELTSRTISNYRSSLLRFLNWMQAQKWYHEAAETYAGKYTPTLYAKTYLDKARRGKRSYAKEPYGLKESELTISLLEELEELHKFCTATRIPKRKDPPIREVTFQGHKRSILSFLGWLKNIKGWRLDDLCLEILINKELLEEFVCWGINEKSNGCAWAANIGRASLSIAKWKHYKKSNKPLYRDIEEVELIRAYVTELRNEYKVEPSRAALEEKLLTLEQCHQVVNYLKQCCAPKYRNFHTKNPRKFSTKKRPGSAIMKSWTRYLIIAILTYCPVRQREIRELELNKTLFRESDGYWVKLKPEDHKTGSKTGKGREYPLPPHLTADLDEWLQTWRPQIQTDHNLVFCSLGSAALPETLGQPWRADALGHMVSHTMYKATAYLFEEPKRTTPHIFRSIAITWQRQHGRAEQREALAELMGHSVQMADEVYDKTTSKQKTAKSIDWWQTSSTRI